MVVDLFCCFYKVTRPEKALILSFMAGSRSNPYPEQGDSITIKLSEHTETVPKPDGTGVATMVVNTLFEMNYKTGEWKRLKKYSFPRRLYVRGTFVSMITERTHGWIVCHQGRF